MYSSRKPIIYCAGPITGLTYEEATGWRNAIKDLVGEWFEVLSPMRDKASLAGVGKFHGEYRDNLLSRAETIIMRDLTDVERADALIVYVPKNYKLSVGTPIEMGMAVALRKPIIMVTDKEDTLRDHPFVKRLPKLVMVDDLDEAAAVVTSLFNL